MKFPGTKRILFWAYVLLICAVLRAAFFYHHLNSPLNLSQDYVFQVPPGATFSQVLNTLVSDEILGNAFDIKLYARLSGDAAQIKAGEYSLIPSTTPRQMLAKLVRGDVKYHQLVLVEGWTLAQAITAIQSHPLIVTSFDAADRAAIASLLESDNYPEGSIFPDTYNFTRGIRDTEILLRARRMMDEVLAQEWATRDVGLPYASPYEALILASIVEKETAVPRERTQIAGVFVRRLQQGMRLQTDPTVIYALGDSFDGNLSRADLRLSSPYNTYLNSGLPPTPIALPGRESIAASLHPDQSDTLYFVAKGDGSHYFSSTLEEHNQAVRRFQLDNGQ